jgi:hypothetical protein
MIHWLFWPAEGPAGLHSIPAKFNNKAALQSDLCASKGLMHLESVVHIHLAAPPGHPSFGNLNSSPRDSSLQVMQVDGEK